MTVVANGNGSTVQLFIIFDDSFTNISDLLMDFNFFVAADADAILGK